MMIIWLLSIHWVRIAPSPHRHAVYGFYLLFINVVIDDLRSSRITSVWVALWMTYSHFFINCRQHTHHRTLIIALWLLPSAALWLACHHSAIGRLHDQNYDDEALLMKTFHADSPWFRCLMMNVSQCCKLHTTAPIGLANSLSGRTLLFTWLQTPPLPLY